MNVVYNNLFYIDKSFTTLIGPVDKNIKEINLHPNTTCIYPYAFNECKNLKTLTGSCKNALTIQSNAFYKCKSLENIELISRKPICVNGNAFYKCNIKNMKISAVSGFLNSFNNIDDTLEVLEVVNLTDKSQFDNFFWIFCTVKNLKNLSVEIGNAIYKDFVGNNALLLYPRLKEEKFLQVPDYFKSISTSAFANPYIEKIVLPESIENIKKNAFYDCKNLKTIVIKSNDIILEDGFHAMCDNLKKIFLSKKAYENNLKITKNNPMYKISDIEFLIDENKSFKEINDIYKKEIF